MLLNMIVYSFDFYINDTGRFANIIIFEMITKRNKNIILLGCSKAQKCLRIDMSRDYHTNV